MHWTNRMSSVIITKGVERQYSCVSKGKQNGEMSWNSNNNTNKKKFFLCPIYSENQKLKNVTSKA